MVRSTNLQAKKPSSPDKNVGNGKAAWTVVSNHVKKAVQNNGRAKSQSIYGIDALDMQIIPLIVTGNSNAQIASKLGKPLSTIQRRTRKLEQGQFVIPMVHLNFKKFGLRRGIVQFKCKSANLKQAVEKISEIDGVESASAYLGSLDVIARVAYSESSEVLDIIAKAQELDLINDVTWSEEIHSVPV